jgi:hypothetical protein
MSKNQNSGGKPSRLLMTVLAALIVSAISLFYLNFTSSRESGKQKPTPPQKAVYTEPHAAYFHPESSEVVQNFQEVKDDIDPAKTSSKILAFVKPPLPGMKPEAVTCFMDNESGGTITCESGSVAVIPPNAFVDAKGKPVKDKVKVSFTEYRDYKDIFFSGIPMTYNNGQFESAGMMELVASTDNGQVYMSPGKLTRVMLATNDQRPGYDLYYFNKKTGSWEEKGKDKIVYKKKDLKRSIPARIMAPFKPKQRAVYITSFEGIPEDCVFLWWRSPGKDFDFSFIKLNKSFPELKSLSGMKWEYQGTDAKEVYTKLFNVAEKDKNRPVRRGYWQSYTAVMNPEEASITLTFINEEE